MAHKYTVKQTHRAKHRSKINLLFRFNVVGKKFFFVILRGFAFVLSKIYHKNLRFLMARSHLNHTVYVPFHLTQHILHVRNEYEIITFIAHSSSL